MQHQSQSKDIPSRAVWKVPIQGDSQPSHQNPYLSCHTHRYNRESMKEQGVVQQATPGLPHCSLRGKREESDIWTNNTLSKTVYTHTVVYSPLWQWAHWIFFKRGRQFSQSSWQPSKVKLTGVTCSHKKKLIGEFGKSAIITNILYAILIDINSLLIKRKLFLTMKNPFWKFPKYRYFLETSF